MAVTLEDERRKYEKVYRSGVYKQKNSVGASVVPIAWGWMRGLGCLSATDWGCGFGRATRWLRNQSPEIRVHGIDLIETGPMIGDDYFHKGTLWDPPDRLPETDFAFSADVLEHLPEERVPEALEWMRARTRIGGWLQIATIPDNLGEKVNERLHLTVRPAVWWRSTVGAFFHVQATQVTEREVRLWLAAG